MVFLRSEHACNVQWTFWKRASQNECVFLRLFASLFVHRCSVWLSNFVQSRQNINKFCPVWYHVVSQCQVVFNFHLVTVSAHGVASHQSSVTCDTASWCEKLMTDITDVACHIEVSLTVRARKFVVRLPVVVVVVVSCWSSQQWSTQLIVYHLPINVTWIMISIAASHRLIVDPLWLQPIADRQTETHCRLHSGSTGSCILCQQRSQVQQVANVGNQTPWHHVLSTGEQYYCLNLLSQLIWNNFRNNIKSKMLRCYEIASQ